MKEVLFVHSAGPQGHFEGSDFLLSYLRKTLGNDYAIVSPEMPDPENPHYDLWSDQLEKEFAALNSNAVVVGHSLGASVVLKYLSESPQAKPVSALFLIATPYWGEKNWEVEEYALVDDFPRKLPSIPHVFLYHSTDDEVVPVNHLERYADDLPEAQVRECYHGGHLFSKGLPELINDIKSL
ncbi:MAG TPA: alpha/beta fold hydrolase [Ohtaekwangia sp.]